MKKILFGALAIAMTLALSMGMASCGDKGGGNITISFDANGGTGTRAAIHISSGSTLTTAQLNGAGFTGPEGKPNFGGWLHEADKASDDATKRVTTAYEFTRSETLYALWSDEVLVPMVTITFDPAGGTIAGVTGTYTVEIELGHALMPADFKTATRAPATEWALDGWYMPNGTTKVEAGSATDPSAGTKFDDDTTITAHWFNLVLTPDTSDGWVEEVTLWNASRPLYEFDTENAQYGEYEFIEVSYKVNGLGMSTGLPNHRLYGNYGISEDGGDSAETANPGSAGDAGSLVGYDGANGLFAVNIYIQGERGNAGYIYSNNELGNNLGGQSGLGAEENEWFTVRYKLIDNTAHGGFVAEHKPAADRTGKFYFAFGLTADKADRPRTSLVKGVKMIPKTGSSAAEVTGKPLYYTSGGEDYPAFIGNFDPNVADTSRKTLQGDLKATIEWWGEAAVPPCTCDDSDPDAHVCDCDELRDECECYDCTICYPPFEDCGCTGSDDCTCEPDECECAACFDSKLAALEALDGGIEATANIPDMDVSAGLVYKFGPGGNDYISFSMDELNDISGVTLKEGDKLTFTFGILSDPASENKAQFVHKVGFADGISGADANNYGDAGNNNGANGYSPAFADDLEGTSTWEFMLVSGDFATGKEGIVVKYNSYGNVGAIFYFKLLDIERTFAAPDDCGCGGNKHRCECDDADCECLDGEPCEYPDMTGHVFANRGDDDWTNPDGWIAGNMAMTYISGETVIVDYASPSQGTWSADWTEGNTVADGIPKKMQLRFNSTGTILTVQVVSLTFVAASGDPDDDLVVEGKDLNIGAQRMDEVVGEDAMWQYSSPEIGDLAMIGWDIEDEYDGTDISDGTYDNVILEYIVTRVENN